MSFQGPTGSEHLLAHIPDTPDDGKTEARRVEHVRLVEEGPGDRGWLWRLAGYRAGDEFYYRGPALAARFSKMFALPIVDGNWSQAMFGNLSFLLPIVGLIAGILAAAQVHGEALPPTLALMATITALAILNPLAGVFAFAPVLAAALFLGNISSIHEAVTLFVLGSMWIPGPQISRRLRPLQRHLDRKGFDRMWHFIGDFVVQVVITAFIMGKFVFVMPIVSGVEVPIANNERQMWLVVLCVVPVRQLLETASREWFPRRSAVVEARAIPHRNHWLSLFFEIVVQGSIVIGCLATAIGFCWQLWVISGAYALMLIVEEIEAEFPHVTWIHRIAPVGITRIVLVVLVGQFAARYFIEKGIHSPQQLTASIFIIVALMLFVLASIAKFPGKPWGAHPVWKALGASVIVMLVLLATSTVTFA
jgi:hypothetical protein